MSRFYLNLIFLKKRTKVKIIKQIYTHISKWAFWTCLILSVGLIVTSFILPPTGSIDPTVLGATGELFGFGVLGTVIDALHKGSDVTISKGDMNVQINNPENKEE